MDKGKRLPTFRQSSRPVSTSPEGGTWRRRGKSRGKNRSRSSLGFQNGSSNNVIVSVRVRPPFEREVAGKEEDDIVATFAVPHQKKILLMEPNKENHRGFVFDYVFGPDQTQLDVYNSIGRPVVQHVLNGVNGTIMAYGQTGTGKTYTMGILGHFEESENGLVPRCFQDIFDQIHHNDDADCEWTCRISLLQIYMEMIQDLLQPENGNLTVRESRKSGTVSVSGLHHESVSNANEASEIVLRGLHNRNIAPTLMNTTSSRAHTVLALEIVCKTLHTTTTSILRLVDLAGSERVNRTHSSGSRLDEAKHINKSLSVLGHVISGLASHGNNTHIPFRDSKLTRILKDVLQGNSNTVLITTISPSLSSFSETLSTLMFAQRCMKVHINPTVDERDSTDYKQFALQIQRQISALQSTDFIRMQQQQILEKNHLQNSSFSPKEHKKKMKQYKNLRHRSPQHDTSDSRSNGGIRSNLSSNSLSASRSNGNRSHQMQDIADTNDLDVMWGLVTALYDTLWEIHDASMYNLHQSLKRMHDTDMTWSQYIEEHSDEPLVMEALTNVKNRFPIQLINSNSNSHSSMLDSFLTQQLVKRGPTQSQSIEEFVAEVAQLHRTVVGQFLCVSRFLEIRDLQSDEIRHEIVNKEIDAASQEQDMENWNDILIRTLKANTNLRKVANTRIFSQRQDDRFANGRRSAIPSEDSLAVAVRYNSAAITIQRAFREAQYSRTQVPQSSKQSNSAGVMDALRSKKIDSGNAQTDDNDNFSQLDLFLRRQ